MLFVTQLLPLSFPVVLSVYLWRTQGISTQTSPYRPGITQPVHLDQQPPHWHLGRICPSIVSHWLWADAK